jgi:glycosyltransferase involved in cell wall biosynthesis
MAGLALSFSAPTPRPRIVASRRVDFHLQAHSFSRWKYRQVDLFLAASNAIKAILVGDGIDASQIVVVHDGIDVGKIGRLPAVDIHAEYWLPRGAPVIVNVGALVDHKGQKYLIAAMPLVLTAIPDAFLIIFGEGELRVPLEKQIKQLGLEKQVRLAGFREDVLQLVKSADLFVMSSVTEGLGSTVLDAMAMSLPVVGTRAGGIPEAVVHNETGVLVHPADSSELATAIVKLLKDPKRRQEMGERGLKRVTEQFGVARFLDGTLKAYRRALEMKPSTAALNSSAHPSGRA